MSKGKCRNLIFAVLLAEGEVSEWLKEHAWKVCIVETLSRVRIPPSPQITRISPIVGIFYLK